MEERDRLNDLTKQIIGTAMRVHTTLGPGLLESVYEACLAYELTEKGLLVEQQKALPVIYHDVRLECGYRLDIMVEDAVIVEIKAVESLERIHAAQLLSYLRLSGWSARQFQCGVAYKGHPKCRQRPLADSNGPFALLDFNTLSSSFCYSALTPRTLRTLR